MAKECAFANLPDWLFQVCIEPRASLVEAAKGKSDAIQLAAEIGRLDHISALMTFLALVVALGALGWGAIVYRQASSVARQTAERQTDRFVAKYLRDDGEAVIRRTILEWLSDPVNRDVFTPGDATEADLADLARTIDENGEPQ